jgi:hypothetical protein
LITAAKDRVDERPAFAAMMGDEPMAVMMPTGNQGGAGGGGAAAVPGMLMPTMQCPTSPSAPPLDLRRTSSSEAPALDLDLSAFGSFGAGPDSGAGSSGLNGSDDFLSLQLGEMGVDSSPSRPASNAALTEEVAGGLNLTVLFQQSSPTRRGADAGPPVSPATHALLDALPDYSFLFKTVLA